MTTPHAVEIPEMKTLLALAVNAKESQFVRAVPGLTSMAAGMDSVA